MGETELGAGDTRADRLWRRNRLLLGDTWREFFVLVTWLAVLLVGVGTVGWFIFGPAFSKTCAALIGASYLGGAARRYGTLLIYRRMKASELAKRTSR